MSRCSNNIMRVVCAGGVVLAASRPAGLPRLRCCPPVQCPPPDTTALAWGTKRMRATVLPRGRMVTCSTGGSPGVSANATARAASMMAYLWGFRFGGGLGLGEEG